MRLLLVTWLCAFPVQAAPVAKRPPLSQALRGEALERYEGARQDFKVSRYQPALSGFVRAHVLSGDPRLLWNAAACLRKLERNAEALKNIDRYLAEGSELTSDERDEARRAQVAVRALVAVVHLTTVPPDVAVTLDGSPIARPEEGLYVEPGRHAFHFSHDGLLEKHREETLRAAEEVTWTVELAPVPVALTPSIERAPAVEVKPPPPAPARVRWAPWVVAGGGAAAGILGGAFLGISSAAYERFRQQCGTICSPQRWAGSRDLELAGGVLLAVGGAAIGAGLMWWLLGAEPVARVTLGPAHVTFEVRF